MSDAFRAQVLSIVREGYADFGPTLAAEYLAERHGITLSHEALRQLMAGACGRPKAAKRAWLHQPRYRRERRGELIQADGSDHDWFEGRAPRCSLLAYIDHAASEFDAPGNDRERERPLLPESDTHLS